MMVQSRCEGEDDRPTLWSLVDVMTRERHSRQTSTDAPAVRCNCSIEIGMYLVTMPKHALGL